MAYPVALADFRTRVDAYDLLASLPDAELQAALDTAQAEVGLYCPAASDGTLPTNLTLAARTIHSDLALYHLRMAFERDADTGAPPKALADYRRDIQGRLDRLATASKVRGAMSFATYPSLGEPPAPGLTLAPDEDDE